MKRKQIRVIPHRRKRKQKTNYKRRLGLLKSGIKRLVIRKSLNNMVAQIIEYHPEGDKVIASSHSRELLKKAWNFNKRNLPACYLVGYMLGKKSLSKNVKEAILDIGLQKSVKGSRIYACLKGAVDAGLTVNCSDDVFPSPERVEGKHISEEVAKKFKEIKEKA